MDIAEAVAQSRVAELGSDVLLGRSVDQQRLHPLDPNRLWVRQLGHGAEWFDVAIDNELQVILEYASFHGGHVFQTMETEDLRMNQDLPPDQWFELP